MVFSKNNVKMFKWTHEKQANGFTAKFFFTITLNVFDVHFRWSFSEKKARKRKTPPSRHFPQLTHWPQLSTDQSAKTHPVIEKRQQQDLGERKTNYTGKFELALTKTQNNPENLKEVKWKSKQKH